METSFHIAVRLLFAKKRAMLMSLSGIVFGVGLFIITQAQTAGFEQYFVRTALSTDGALHVEDRIQDTLAMMAVRNASGSTEDAVSMGKEMKFAEGVQFPVETAEALHEFENVAAVSPVLRDTVVLDSGSRKMSAQIFGVNIDDFVAVSDIGRQVVFGQLDDFRGNPKGAMLGSILASRINVVVGDSISLSHAGHSERYRVEAIFESGVEDVDKQRVFVHLPEARAVLGQPFGVTYLQASLRDSSRAIAEAPRMQETLGHRVVSWQEREKTWLGIFRAIRASSALTVTIIILISGLGMFNTLAVIVLEKTKEIAILRSMGYTRQDITRIFLLLGCLVLIAGCVLGCAFGLVGTWLLTTIPLPIRGIFSSDHFVVIWSIWHYLAAMATAAVVVLIASWIPARRAARLEPGNIIRGAAH